VSPEEALFQVETLRDEWGESDLDEIDLLDLWERLDAILRSVQR
jgi:hypothetical protein